MAVIFVFLLFLITEISLAAAQQRNSNISLGSSLSPTSDKSFWSSHSGQFAFGFYPNGHGFSVGIWYATIAPKTVIWTANRDDPPLSRDTTLLLSNDGRLILRQEEDHVAEKTIVPGLAALASSASMLDTGNFVLYNSSSQMIWQSFGTPTDTLLPSQRLVAGNKLISSISKNDHSTGKFLLIMQTDGNLVQYPALFTIPVEPAYWNAETYKAGANVTLNLDDKGKLYLVNSSGFDIKTLNDGGNPSDKMLYRMTIDADGIFRVYSHGLNQSGDWAWSSSGNRCDPPGLCGPNEYCTLMNQEPDCTCLPGFVFIDKGHKDLGCKRNYVRNENISYNFYVLENIGWLDGSYSTLPNKSRATCEDECLKDYNCEVVLYKDAKCMKQKLPLQFGRFQVSEQMTTLVKVGSKECKKEKKIEVVVIASSVAVLTIAFTVLAISGVLVYRYRVKGYKKILSHGNDELIEDVILRSFTYAELEQASNGFVEEVGKGAFGTVFKGFISNGERVVAIKRLEIVVAEGEREFRNEMKVIGRTHHKNLVKLLGYCHDGTNRLLVYEFMSNGSLADFLFRSETKPSWDERIGIAVNVARGILYLHDECETRIIHCDIKPENILMDESRCAKIADFGLAKLMTTNQTRTHTAVRGTRGYVAPEWHRNLPITVKADVYSFGIMLLEIICCRRSLDMDLAEDEVVLANWVYDCFEASELDKLVQDEEVDKSKLERMVRVGIWCIQDDPSLRPSMKKVVLMLEGTVDIPTPPSPTSFLSSI